MNLNKFSEIQRCDHLPSHIKCFRWLCYFDEISVLALLTMLITISLDLFNQASVSIFINR